MEKGMEREIEEERRREERAREKREVRERERIDTHIAGSFSSISGNTDDSITDNAIDIIALFVADDRGTHKVQELKRKAKDTFKPVKGILKS
jgi:hypothetical protein